LRQQAPQTARGKEDPMLIIFCRSSRVFFFFFGFFVFFFSLGFSFFGGGEMQRSRAYSPPFSFPFFFPFAGRLSSNHTAGIFFCGEGRHRHALFFFFFPLFRPHRDRSREMGGLKLNVPRRRFAFSFSFLPVFSPYSVAVTG